MSTYQTNAQYHFSDEFFIFERMAEGDQRALHFFFDKYYDNLCNYANLYVRSKSVGEELEVIQSNPDKIKQNPGYD